MNGFFYNKVFAFRDCSAESIREANAKGINKLLNNPQNDGFKGIAITDGVLEVGVITSVEISNITDEGEYDIYLSRNNEEIACVDLVRNKEVQFHFEIEESIESDDFILHGCKLKVFSDYQMD